MSEVGNKVDESVEPETDMKLESQDDSGTDGSAELAASDLVDEVEPADVTADGEPEPAADPLDDTESNVAELSETTEPAELSVGVLAELVDPDRLAAAIEALLFVVESPISVAAIAAVVQRPTSEVDDALAALAEQYSGANRGIEIRWIAGGVRVYTRPELSEVVEAFLLDGQRTKLSQAALETLAVIAYRQPVSRGRISAIRGVNVDGVVRTLTSRGLVVEDGNDVDSGAGLFRTTAAFLEKMGLQSLDELPSLAPLIPEIDTLETDEL